MEHQEAESCYFRAREIAKRVYEYIKEREVDFKQRERYNRYPRQLPPAEAVAAVLTDELLDAFTAELLIKELGRTGSAQLALALLDLLASSSSPALCKPAFDAAISVCSTRYLAGEAVRVYRLLPQYGYEPDVHTCNMTITACSQGGDVKAVMEVLEDMQSRGIVPNDFTALMALQACMFKRRGRHEEAIQIVQMLLAAGRRPSDEVSDAVLSVCEATMDKAATLEASQAAFQALQALGLHSCTRAYNAILRACARRGDWRTAQGYFDEMVAAGIPSNTEIFNSLIKACLAGGALQNALAIFEWMVSGRHVGEDIQADITTYNVLIKACHQAGHLEKALEIMAWLEQSGVEFDSTTYEELIGVAEIAEIWDAKAIHDATNSALAVFPEHLRPAPFDAMRLNYLEHLAELAEEEHLAFAKLGGISWVSSSLTKGSQLPPATAAHQSAAAAATGPGLGSEVSGTPSVFLAPSKRGTGRLVSSPLVLSRMPSLKNATLEGLAKAQAQAGLPMPVPHSHASLDANSPRMDSPSALRAANGTSAGAMGRTHSGLPRAGSQASPLPSLIAPVRAGSNDASGATSPAGGRQPGVSPTGAGLLGSGPQLGAGPLGAGGLSSPLGGVRESRQASVA